MLGDSKLDSPAFSKLWSMMLDESKLESNYTKPCINAIVDIIRRSSSKSEKEKYLEICIDHMKKGISVPQALSLFIAVCGTISSYGFFLSKETASKIDDFKGFF